jgi:hypothetical protein
MHWASCDGGDVSPPINYLQTLTAFGIPDAYGVPVSTRNALSIGRKRHADRMAFITA